MSKKTVNQDIDLANLPPLNKQQKAELAALSARTDKELDYSDTPPLTAKFWSDAERGKFYKPGTP